MTQEEERVKNGARFLDKKNPDWFNKINLLKLDIGSYVNCILGQLYGYWTGLQLLFSDSELIRNYRLSDLAITMGFTFDSVYSEAPICELNQYWTNEIMIRRNKCLVRES